MRTLINFKCSWHTKYKNTFFTLWGKTCLQRVPFLSATDSGTKLVRLRPHPQEKLLCGTIFPGPYLPKEMYSTSLWQWCINSAGWLAGHPRLPETRPKPPASHTPTQRRLPTCPVSCLGPSRAPGVGPILTPQKRVKPIEYPTHRSTWEVFSLRLAGCPSVPRAVSGSGLRFVGAMKLTCADKASAG